MIQKPRIQLSTGINAEHYIKAVTGCGGIPVAAYCPAPDLTCDGLIICGGSDVHPNYFGEEITGSTDIDIDRDEAEMALADAFVKAGKPVLGICRGHQLLNIYFGGSLIQDIDCASVHTSFGQDDLVHTVKAEDNSVVGTLYGDAFSVNSHHHQAVSRLGDGFRAVAAADGSIIEAIEHNVLPVWGVQWHPERMCFLNARSDTVDGAKLIAFFVEVCRSKSRSENVDK